jgi:hypothetical protein
MSIIRAYRIKLRGVWVGIGLLGLTLILQFGGDRVQAALPQASTISITMSNPSCVQVVETNGICSIQVHNLYASGSDPSLSRVEVLVNGKLRININGFFEADAYFTDQMLPGGLKVVCGMPNASGSKNFGRIYSITANAYMVDGATASDNMNVACPAFVAKNYFPFLKKGK